MSFSEALNIYVDKLHSNQKVPEEKANILTGPASQRLSFRCQSLLWLTYKDEVKLYQNNISK